MENERLDFKEISAFETPEQSSGFLLWHVSSSWRRLIEGALSAMELTHPQFVLLATLGWLTKEGGSTTQAALGKMAGLDPNTTSQVLRGLENRGLIKRIAGSDGRVKNPVLTSTGKALIKRALPEVEAADERFFSPLSEAELRQLIKISKKLIL